VHESVESCERAWRQCKTEIQGSTQIVLVGKIFVAILQFYGLGIEAVQEPVGVRLDAPVLLAVWKQREQSMAWLAGDFPLSHHLISMSAPPSVGHATEGGAVAIPSSDAASQDALNGAAVELRAHAKPFQLPERKRP
jgi:hypothetical protein